MDVQDAVVEDHFDAVRVPDGVLVRMSRNVEATLARQIAELIRFLAEDVVPERRGLRRTAAAVERRLFPDAYRTRVDSADLRARHRDRLRDTGPATRVAAQCLAGSPFVLDENGVDDWIGTIGLLRMLRPPRERRLSSVNGRWYTHIQTLLVLAVDPRA
ncbi:MAG: hypothetical protein HOY78_31390 [Saccharothrix sp.]|nr:hypothetical protein [Saccharothrix sp.]